MFQVVAKLMCTIEREEVPDDLKQTHFYQVSVFTSWVDEYHEGGGYRGTSLRTKEKH